MMFDTNVSSTNKWNVCCESRPYTGWNTEIDVFQCYVLEWKCGVALPHLVFRILGVKS